MSDTPPAQKFGEKLERLFLSIDEVRDVCMERIRVGRRDGWTAEHIAACKSRVKELTELEFHMRALIER